MHTFQFLKSGLKARTLSSYFEIDADKDALDISGAFTLNLWPSSLCSNHLVTNCDNSSHSCNLQSNRFCKQNFSHASLFKFVINSNRNNNKNSLTLKLCESSAIPRLVNSLCKCSANCQSREPPCLERPGRAASTGAQRDEAGLPRRVTPVGARLHCDIFLRSVQVAGVRCNHLTRPQSPSTLFFACCAPSSGCLSCHAYTHGCCHGVLWCLHVCSNPGPGAPNWGDSSWQPSLASHSPC